MGPPLKICVTPTALASDSGYQTQNTHANINNEINIEIVKCVRKNLTRLDIYKSFFIATLLVLFHSKDNE